LNSKKQKALEGSLMPLSMLADTESVQTALKGLLILPPSSALILSGCEAWPDIFFDVL